MFTVELPYKRLPYTTQPGEQWVDLGGQGTGLQIAGQKETDQQKQARLKRAADWATQAKNRMTDLQNKNKLRERTQSAQYQADVSLSRLRQITNPRNNYMQMGVDPNSAQLINALVPGSQPWGAGDMTSYELSPVEQAQQAQATQRATLQSEESRGMIRREMAKRGLSGTAQEKAALANIDAQERGVLQNISNRGTFNRMAYNQAIARGYGARGRANAQLYSRADEAQRQRDWQSNENELMRQHQQKLAEGKLGFEGEKLAQRGGLAEQKLTQQQKQFDTTQELKKQWWDLANEKQMDTVDYHNRLLQFNQDTQKNLYDLGQQRIDLQKQFGEAKDVNEKNRIQNEYNRNIEQSEWHKQMKELSEKAIEARGKQNAQKAQEKQTRNEERNIEQWQKHYGAGRNFAVERLPHKENETPEQREAEVDAFARNYADKVHNARPTDLLTEPATDLLTERAKKIIDHYKSNPTDKANTKTQVEELVKTNNLTRQDADRIYQEIDKSGLADEQPLLPFTDINVDNQTPQTPQTPPQENSTNEVLKTELKQTVEFLRKAGFNEPEIEERVYNEQDMPMYRKFAGISKEEKRKIIDESGVIITNQIVAKQKALEKIAQESEKWVQNQYKQTQKIAQTGFAEDLGEGVNKLGGATDTVMDLVKTPDDFSALVYGYKELGKDHNEIWDIVRTIANYRLQRGYITEAEHDQILMNVAGELNIDTNKKSLSERALPAIEKTGEAAKTIYKSGKRFLNGGG